MFVDTYAFPRGSHAPPENVGRLDIQVFENKMGCLCTSIARGEQPNRRRGTLLYFLLVLQIWLLKSVAGISEIGIRDLLEILHEKLMLSCYNGDAAVTHLYFIAA